MPEHWVGVVPRTLRTLVDRMPCSHLPHRPAPGYVLRWAKQAVVTTACAPLTLVVLGAGLWSLSFLAGALSNTLPTAVAGTWNFALAGVIYVTLMIASGCLLRIRERGWNACQMTPHLCRDLMTVSAYPLLAAGIGGAFTFGFGLRALSAQGNVLWYMFGSEFPAIIMCVPLAVMTRLFVSTDRSVWLVGALRAMPYMLLPMAGGMIASTAAYKLLNAPWAAPAMAGIHLVIGVYIYCAWQELFDESPPQRVRQRSCVKARALPVFR